MEQYGESDKRREETAKLAGAVILEMEKLDGVLKDVVHVLASRNIARVTLTRHAPAQIGALMRDLAALEEHLEMLSTPVKQAE